MKKRGIASEALPWILISIVVLALSIVILALLKGKGTSIIDSIKLAFRRT